MSGILQAEMAPRSPGINPLAVSKPPIVSSDTSWTISSTMILIILFFIMLIVIAIILYLRIGKKKTTYQEL